MKTSLLIPALLASACVSVSPEKTPGPETGLPTAVTVSCPERDGGFDSVDLLVYDSSSLQKLVGHWRGKSAAFKIVLGPGDYRFVALANLNGELNEEAVSRYEYLESLSYSLGDEDPDAPLMSGAGFGPAGQAVNLELSPLLCELEVFSIENRLDGTEVRDLCIYLLNVNSRAEPMRWSGFRPSRMLNGGWLDLKEVLSLRCPSMLYSDLRCDIGKNALRPHRSLFCYPNDSEEAGLGAPETVIAIEGTVNGERRRWEKSPGPLKRAQKKGVELVLESDE